MYKERNAEIVRLFVDEFISQSELARRFHVSDTRINQLLRRQGVNPTFIWRARLAARRTKRREQQAQLRHQRSAESVARKTRRIDSKYELWRQLWDAGIPTSQMAQQLHTSLGALMDRIAHYRRTRGWFPLRVKWVKGKPGPRPTAHR